MVTTVAIVPTRENRRIQTLKVLKINNLYDDDEVVLAAAVPAAPESGLGGGTIDRVV